MLGHSCAARFAVDGRRLVVMSEEPNNYSQHRRAKVAGQNMKLLRAWGVQSDKNNSDKHLETSSLNDSIIVLFDFFKKHCFFPTYRPPVKSE